MTSKSPPPLRVVHDGRILLGKISVSRREVIAWIPTGRLIGTFPDTVQAINALKREALLAGARSS